MKKMIWLALLLPTMTFAAEGDRAMLQAFWDLNCPAFNNQCFQTRELLDQHDRLNVLEVNDEPVLKKIVWRDDVGTKVGDTNTGSLDGSNGAAFFYINGIAYQIDIRDYNGNGYELITEVYTFFYADAGCMGDPYAEVYLTDQFRAAVVEDANGILWSVDENSTVDPAFTFLSYSDDGGGSCNQYTNTLRASHLDKQIIIPQYIEPLHFTVE